MYLLIKPESILVTIINENSTTVSDFDNLYKEHKQPY